jgi:hypothetical protein
MLVAPASARPHATIVSYAANEFEQLRENPCIVTPSATRMPIAAILSPAGRSESISHTPLRPSTRCPGIPNSASTSMSMPSRRRTYATTSTGSASLTIG